MSGCPPPAPPLFLFRLIRLIFRSHRSISSQQAAGRLLRYRFRLGPEKRHVQRSRAGGFLAMSPTAHGGTDGHSPMGRGCARSRRSRWVAGPPHPDVPVWLIAADGHDGNGVPSGDPVRDGRAASNVPCDRRIVRSIVQQCICHARHRHACPGQDANPNAGAPGVISGTQTKLQRFLPCADRKSLSFSPPQTVPGTWGLSEFVRSPGDRIEN